MQNNCDTSDDEVSLSELWQALVRYKWLVVGMPIVAMALAFLVTNLIKPQWEAVALVRIGQFGQVGVLVEPANRALERVKQVGFQREVFSGVGLTDRNSQGGPLFEASLYRASFQVKAVPNATDLIEMNVRGYSRQEAKANIEATVAYLREIHDRMMAPTIARLKEQSARVKLQLESARAARDSLTRTAKLQQQPHSSDHFMANVELAIVLFKRDAELRELEQLMAVVEEQLNPLRTYSTSLFDSVFVEEYPVSPKKLRVTELSGLVGLILGMLMAFALNPVRAKSCKTAAFKQSQ
jgi:LPS O-antigen subunit length determinant protein (WzzB/FepE family)